jgi:hypothetical protein
MELHQGRISEMRLKSQQRTTTLRLNLARRPLVRQLHMPQAHLTTLNAAPCQDTTWSHQTQHSGRTLKPQPRATVLHHLIGKAIVRPSIKNRLARQVPAEKPRLSFSVFAGVHGRCNGYLPPFPRLERSVESSHKRAANTYILYPWASVYVMNI